MKQTPAATFSPNPSALKPKILQTLEALNAEIVSTPQPPTLYQPRLAANPTLTLNPHKPVASRARTVLANSCSSQAWE